jgi:hypothetical protein
VSSCREASEVFADQAHALGCKGAVDVEKITGEWVSERKAALDKRLVEPSVTPPTERSAETEAASDASASINRDAKTSREIPLPAPARTEQTHTEVAVSSSFAVQPGKRRRAYRLGFAIAAAVAIAGAIGVRSHWFARPAPAAIPSVAPPPIVEPPPSAAQPAPAPAESQRISLIVANDVAMVVVAGKLHKERPVVVELRPDQRVSVELGSKSGKVSERQIGVEDDGTTLSTAVRSEAPRGTAKRPLFSSPY